MTPAGTPGSPGQPRPQRSAPPPARRVLFLGSSLTYANDMPATLQGLALAAGLRLQVEVVARGGASLEDHWQQGDARRAIARGGWSHVVLQQGPSSTPENRENLRQMTRRFAAPIRQAGARPALYMVWPGPGRMAWFDEVRSSYTLAAEDVDGMLLPAGEAWRAVWRRQPDVKLLRRDGVHPSPLGSWTIALCMFGMLSGRSPEGLPARIRLPGGGQVQVPAAVAPLLAHGAAEANAAWGRP